MAIGAYAVERDYSHYVAYAAKTILAVVGTATKGPVGVATVCTSTQDLVNKFGPLSPECYALYAGQYFLSQSSKLYFVRAASSNKESASISIKGKDSSDGDILDAVTFSFLEYGTYYDNYRVVLSKVTTTEVVNSTSTVTITTSIDTPTNTLGAVATTSKTSTRAKRTSDSVGTTSIITYNIAITSPTGTVIEVLEDVSLDDLVVATTNTPAYTTENIEVSAVNLTSVSYLVPNIYITAGGNNGITDITAADYNSAAATLSADTIDMNLVAVPGVYDPSVIHTVIQIAENRGDCLYIIDPPSGLTKEAVADWHNGNYNSESYEPFTSSYGAIYYDWVYIYDSVNKQKVLVPPSVLVVPSIANSDRTTELWYAPAGLNRGVIKGALDSATKLNKSDVEYLYTANNAINPLYDDPQAGLVIWGQKTTYRGDTALNRVNVRRLMNYLKRVVTAACNYLTFEPNDRVTWNSFEMKILPVLKSIKDRRGIYEYQIVKGETIVTNDDIDNYRMPCMIMIRPTKAAEEIPIYFTITSTGADFNTVLEANGIVVE